LSAKLVDERVIVAARNVVEVLHANDLRYFCYFKGKRVFDENHFLVSGFRPAGSGEASIAIAFADSRNVDVVKIYAWDRLGHVIGQTSVPVNIRWTTHVASTHRSVPDWARSLEPEQLEQARKTAARKKTPVSC
jgi:hypothetical protein